MAIDFDPAKDAANIAKHGMSLALAEEMEIEVFIADERRDYGETRYRAFGRVDGRRCCLVFTVRQGQVRAISLRHAGAKELNRHGL